MTQNELELQLLLLDFKEELNPLSIRKGTMLTNEFLTISPLTIANTVMYIQIADIDSKEEYLYTMDHLSSLLAKVIDLTEERNNGY